MPAGLLHLLEEGESFWRIAFHWPVLVSQQLTGVWWR
jgi:hypothetical protein